MIKKLSLITFLFMISISAFSQNWGGGIDDESWSWGFNFQYVSAEYKILKKPDWRKSFYDPDNGEQVTSDLKSISSPPNPGFGLGFVVNGRISDNVDIRSTPSLIFSDRIVRYEYEYKEPEPVGVGPNPPLRNYPTSLDKKVEATMFEFPLGVKIKSNRLNNFRAYWLGGAKYSIDIGSRKKTFDDDKSHIDKFLKSRKNYFSYETGIGFDLYFEYFKVSPEIKLSYSINDLLKHDNTAFANPIDQLKLRQLTFSLIFQ